MRGSAQSIGGWVVGVTAAVLIALLLAPGAGASDLTHGASTVVPASVNPAPGMRSAIHTSCARASPGPASTSAPRPPPRAAA